VAISNITQAIYAECQPSYALDQGGLPRCAELMISCVSAALEKGQQVMQF
jgi:hypothetical protein